MDAAYLAGPLIFLIDAVFSLYVFAIMLRFLLQWVEADFYNPISQFLVKLTHPPLRYLRRAIPSIGRADMAAVALMFAVQALGGYLIFLIQGVGIAPAALAAWACAQLAELLFNVYLFAIVAAALLSWIHVRGYNPAQSLLRSLTEPLLEMFRRLLPPMGGLDLSPVLALIALQFAKMVALPPIQQLIGLLN
jgi:YggT family protein